MTLSPDQILARFPHASKSTLRANAAAQPVAATPEKIPAPSPAEAALRASWPKRVAAMVAPAKQAKGRIRQNSAGLNKTEQAFYDYLKASYPQDLIYAQAITLRIANGCRYTVDFVLSRAGAFIAYEVKGDFMRDDAAVKIKVAASLFPAITFYLVSRKKGVWQIDRVLP